MQQDASDGLIGRLWRQVQQRLKDNTLAAVPTASSVPTAAKPGAAYCYFWQRGSCSNGTACGYLHQPDPKYDPTRPASDYPVAKPMAKARAPAPAPGGKLPSWQTMARSSSSSTSIGGSS